MIAEDIVARLQVVSTDRLRAHEDIIPFNFQRLRESMLNMGRLVDPIIVDKDNYIVIDGNHRTAVLESIKCPNAACQLIDYKSEEIGIGGWFPVSKTVKPDEIDGFRPEKVDFEAGKAALERMDGTFLYVRKVDGKKECFLYNSNERTVQGVIAQQRKFLAAIEQRDAQYVADDKVEEYLARGYTAFYRRLYTKGEIVAEALAGRRMPPKSTRHTIPERIIRLNLHLGWLAESPDVCKQMMDDMLKRRLNEGSIRRYTETVIVLY
ncbi:MAG: ParB N-terminal domain-containing protein [Candidatus Micrarchaeia archaeon]|jgi:hypothetical protein